MIFDALELGPNVPRCGGPLIVGSGPVALTLALHLSRHDIDVVVLEAGGRSALGGSAGDLDVVCSGTKLRGAVIARSRQIGGGLNLWGGQLACPMPEEFGDDTNAANWPVGFDEITRHIGTVGELFGQTIELPLEGIISDQQNAGIHSSGLTWLATAWLRRPKLSGKIWHELANSERVRIIHGAFVDRIDIKGDSGAVEGVSAIREDNTRISFSSDRIVLAGGTIENCRMLLLPSGSETDQPWHSLHWLGRGFNEHLDANTALVEPLDKRKLLDVFDPLVQRGTRYTPKLYARLDVGAGIRLSGVAMLSFPGNIRNSISELAMLLRGLKPKELPANMSSIIAASIGATSEVLPLALRYLRHKRIGSVMRNTSSLRVSVEQPIREASRIILSTSRRDSRGVPSAQMQWHKGPEEGQAFLELTTRVKHWGEKNDIARVTIDPLLKSDPMTFAEAADEGLHHAGGVRMANSPSSGVVDADLQVFNARGLYCCGACVLPNSGFANPTLLAMALAVRLGNRLIAERERR